MSTAQLIEAVKNGDRARVKALLAEGTDVNGHGAEQEWTALNYAAGKGDLEMVQLLVASGADVFQTGRDKRTPFQIAIAACRVEVAKHLKDCEEKAGGDKEGISSRAHEKRPYCRAYVLKELRRFPGWSAHRVQPAGGEEKEADPELRDDDIVFLHRDLTVTKDMWHGENVLFDAVDAAWTQFCRDVLEFTVPDDFDLLPPMNPVAAQEHA